MTATSTTLYRAALLHTPSSPFTDPMALQAEADAGVLVQGGVIADIGPYARVQRAWPQVPSVDLRGGLLLPGFVDTHVHYPQLRIIGGLGRPLLEWLERCALPEEARLADDWYAEQVAREFLRGLLQSGTTSALVFGSHFASAMQVFFQEAARSGLRVVAGQVVGDRNLRPELHTTPERAYQEGKTLIGRWHGTGRLLYAVTPRFSLSSTPELMDACAALMREHPGVRFTSHINENPAEIRAVREWFPGSQDYLATYQRAGLVTRHSVLAHNVHPQERELEVMAHQRCSVAHCPCSNSALGSGLFPLARHLAAGVHVALGTDVGAGTGLSLLKEGLQAYFMQQLLGPQGVALSPAHLLYLATRAGAQALDWQDITGDFSLGKQFDAVWWRPAPQSTLHAVFQHSDSAEAQLAALFALGTPADLAGVWVAGQQLHP